MDGAGALLAAPLFRINSDSDEVSGRGEQHPYSVTFI
jgi:hypothetical protein